MPDSLQPPSLPAVWFPAIRAGTGADVFTQRLCDGLNARGLRAEITWLPHRAEYMPWTVPVPEPPEWANVLHVNTWLHRRFIPKHLPLLATMHHCVHDADLDPYKSKAQSLYHSCWIRTIERHVLKRARKIIAVSRYTARKTSEAFGAVDIQVIYNGVPRADDSLSDREGAAHMPFRLLYVGSWSARKGVDLLGPIMSSLGNNFELWYTSADKSVVRKYNLPPNTRCIGRPSDCELADAYRGCDALLFPVRLEGFGLVAAEAMMHGLPVISTKASAIPEIVEDGGTGLLCPMDDGTAFAAAVRWLASEPDQRLQMARAAHVRARYEFNLESMVDAYVRAYSEIL